MRPAPAGARRVFSAAFRHIGTAAAFASDRLGERADQFAGLERCVRSFVTAATMETAPSSARGEDDDGGFPFVAERVGERAHLLAVEAFDLGDQVA